MGSSCLLSATPLVQDRYVSSSCFCTYNISFRLCLIVESMNLSASVCPCRATPQPCAASPCHVAPPCLMSPHATPPARAGRNMDKAVSASMLLRESTRCGDIQNPFPLSELAPNKYSSPSLAHLNPRPLRPHSQHACIAVSPSLPLSPHVVLIALSSTPCVLLANFTVSVANNLKELDIDSGSLIWTASQVALVEVTPGLCECNTLYTFGISANTCCSWTHNQ